MQLFFEKAIKKTKNNNILLFFHITSNSKIKSKYIYYNNWRNTFEIKLLSIAKNGKANKELLEYLSNIFSIKVTNIIIKSGLFNENKIIEIKNINYNYILEKLSIYLI